MPDEIRVWDLPVRLLHWLLVLAFTAAYLTSESESLQRAHVVLGYVATGLILARIAWGFIGTRYARFSSFLYSPRAALEHLRAEVRGSPPRFLGHNPVGSYAIYAMLVLGLATGATGHWRLREAGGASMQEWHEAFANAWLVVVGLHVVGVVLTGARHREHLVRAMITGNKWADDAPRE